MSTSKESAFWAAVRSDPMVFLQMAFKEIYPGKQLVLNWHIDAIVHSLEYALAGRLTRVIINLPPRNLKSFITSIAWPAFLLGVDPTVKIICVSYSDDLAKRLSVDFRRLIESDWYRRVFPHVEFIKRNEGEVMTDQGGGRFATSVGGSLTGRGADFIIIDDPMKPDDAYSESARNKVNEWYKTTLLSRLDDKQRSVLMIVMQRLHVNDLVGYVQDEGNWHKLSFPAVATRPETIQLRHGQVYHRAAGEALQEEHESLQTLQQLKKLLGSFHFASQYQQTPETPEGNLFQRKYFRLVDRLPVPLRHPDARIFLSVDTASSLSDSADYTAITLVMAYDFNFYIATVRRGRYTYEEALKIILDYATELVGIEIVVEATGIGISLAHSLRNRQISCHHYYPRDNKMMRAAYALPIFAEGRIFVLNVEGKNGWVEPMLNEFVSFPHGRHDDQVDAITQLLPWADRRANGGGSIYFIGGPNPDPNSLRG